jgi:hypothetical protein
MNNILGSMSVKSYNIRSGDVRSRRPNVQDYLDNDAASESAYVAPPELQSAVNWNYSKDKPSPPSPTEFNLPDSVYELKMPIRSKLIEKDSLEMLYNAFNKT